MTPVFMIDKLHEEIEKIIKDYKFPTLKEGEYRNINIYNYDLPKRKQVDKEKDPVPYLIIDPTDGNVDGEIGPYRMSVGLVFCCHNIYGDQNAKTDLLNVFDKIIARFRINPTFDKFKIVTPIRWVIESEDTYPFVVGAMQITVEIPLIEREDLLT